MATTKTAKKSAKRSIGKFALTVPLDASGINDAPKDQTTQTVKVVARDRKGKLYSKTVKLRSGEIGKATFGFRSHPGPLHLAVGPGGATDDELLGLQTISLDVTTRKWADRPLLELSPIVLSPYYWFWWRRWCRTFTIRGKVTCPDGSPVPGAEVCAYDVDWWFIWSSKQLVGCAETDIDGTFEIEFRWCCGFWPWWWWRLRAWQVDDLLISRVSDVLRHRPDLQLSRIDQQPSLAAFEEILGDDEVASTRSLKPTDVSALPGVRDRLLAELPAAPQLEALRIWPWYPWRPWWDCTPDIIFKVTQDCETPGEVILEEGVGATRWNIPNPLDVNLVVSDNACCVPPPCPNPPCDELECLVIDSVCGAPFTQVGGNPGAAATPVGYLNPGPVPADTTGYHRPFGGVIPISKNPNDLAGVDYYEIEVFDDDPTVLDWVPLPPDAAVSFNRRYWDLFNTPHNRLALFKFQDISGHNVVETRSHYESNHPLKWPNEPGPGATSAIWLSQNYSRLLPLNTRKFGDGTYRFQVVGWQEAGGALVNRVVLPVCGSQDPNEFVLTFDNRVTNAVASHDAAHNCSQGVHLCTTEPDSHILAVRIGGVQVDPCDTAGYAVGAMVEIDFLAHDSDRHLAYYVVESSWGLSQSRNLLDRPGVSVVPIAAGTPTGWQAFQSTGNYGTALTQGAVAPHWEGGQYRLTIPLEEAFPDPCCYQLELRAYKRTKVGHTSGCYGYHVSINGNRTEYSLGVGVCPPPLLTSGTIAVEGVVTEED